LGAGARYSLCAFEGYNELLVGGIGYCSRFSDFV
jgi:hypothetical protein